MASTRLFHTIPSQASSDIAHLPSTLNQHLVDILAEYRSNINTRYYSTRTGHNAEIPSLLGYTWQTLLPGTILFLSICLYTSLNVIEKPFVAHLENMESMHDDLLIEQEKIIMDMHRKEQELNNRYEALIRESQQLQQSYHDQIEKSYSLKVEVHVKQHLLEQECLYSRNLKHQLTRLIYRIAIDKYTQEPYFVEFTIQILEQNDTVNRHYFTIEVLSIHENPVAAYIFLDQVKNGLWDGSSLSSNGSNILSALPFSVDGNFSKLPAFQMELLTKTLAVSDDNDGGTVYAPYSFGVKNSEEQPNFFIHTNTNCAHDPIIGSVVIGRQRINRLIQTEHGQITILHAKLVDELSDKARTEYETNKATATDFTLKCSR